MEQQNTEPKADLFKAIGVFFDKLFTTQQNTFDDLAKQHADKIDKLILETEANDKLAFKSGFFTITYVTDTVMKLKVLLYYLDKNGEIVEQKSVTSRDPKCLTPDAFKELKEKKEIKYPIEHP
ncbi:hypothetical protein NZ47_10505 [Anaerovibrio lipolyticus]|uniref:Uncharacterized protein n=1 Tax=Anaerovibrio lipolyticus TaxID=82374 RepID=A0A0B2JUV3_9FIRM|nr:hypothetical protein [Anaerovibrio lipolyticus]KHM51449.1 hypothetical protein NZ47_10505 [Anaerovibrio lipolyticus]